MQGMCSDAEIIDYLHSRSVGRLLGDITLNLLEKKPPPGLVLQTLREAAEQWTAVKSWRMDTVQGLKKEDLVKLSGSAEGKEQLRQLKEELDKCVEWCDRHPEHDDTDVVAAEPSAASADGGGAE
eukprot:Hpha_TRINITY_DN16710_c5_g1::TRINITY_DN16710_c5_g1_i1::g.77970::m.77970